MTAGAAHHHPPGRPQRPPLAVVSTCRCGTPVVGVPARTGARILVDQDPGTGQARRDPDGDWWAVKVGGQWLVTTVLPGEDPPASGVRYRQHRCAGGDPAGGEQSAAAESDRAERLLRATFPAAGGEVGVAHRQGDAGPCAGGCGRAVRGRYGTASGTMCDGCARVLEGWRAEPPGRRGPLVFPTVADGLDPAPVLGLTRPVRRGRGLEGPPCVYRTQYSQVGVGQAMCVQCGRVTVRRDRGDGLAWCGGDLPASS